MMKRTTLPQKTVPNEIAELHNDILNALHTSLEKAIRIGELLTEERKSLEHGQWLPWCEKNLPFTVQTARNYIRTYVNRDELKNKSVLYLDEAYKMLAPVKEEEISYFAVARIELKNIKSYSRYLENYKEGDLVFILTCKTGEEAIVGLNFKKEYHIKVKKKLNEYSEAKDILKLKKLYDELCIVLSIMSESHLWMCRIIGQELNTMSTEEINKDIILKGIYTKKQCKENKIFANMTHDVFEDIINETKVK